MNKELCREIKIRTCVCFLLQNVFQTDVRVRLNNKKAQVDSSTQSSSGVYIGPWGLLKITLIMTECSNNKYKSLKIV